MSTASTTVGLLAEILTIVAFPTGLILLIIAVLIRAIRGGWFEVEALVDGSELRWLGVDGAFYRQELTADELTSLRQDELRTVFCRTSSPFRAHLERVAHDEKALRMLGIVFLGVGVAAVIMSIVSTLTG